MTITLAFLALAALLGIAVLIGRVIAAGARDEDSDAEQAAWLSRLEKPDGRS